MKDTEYAFAVAKIRVAETTLFSEKDADRLIEAESDGEVQRLLSEKGYDAALDTETMLDQAGRTLSAFLKDVSPDKSVVDFLLIGNDYHNLKAALKELVSASDAPSGRGPDGVYAGEEIRKAVLTKRFADLPGELAEKAEKAYELLTNLYDGQAADIYLDQAALAATTRYAGATKNALAIQAAALICALTDIKIAYRAVYTGKDVGFMRRALCPCAGMQTEALIAACMRGADSLTAYLDGAGFPRAAEAIKQSPAEFEKYADDAVTELMRSAKLKSFGPEPLIAFYYAKQTEIKNLRIILSCRRLHIAPAEIRRRVRMLYV